MCKEREYIWDKCQSLFVVSPYLENCNISKESCLNVILLQYLMHCMVLHCTNALYNTLQILCGDSEV